ncbi:MAG: hypothetical protein MUQ10_19210, partial [Anaerolineae bacterium]|nr:hypothetical protein [Anaerolineae bacterium]
FYSVVPLVLGGISWILARRQKALAGVMLLTLFMWPVYHIVTQDPVGTNKHVVFGFLVAYPLIGYGLSVIWEKRHFWPVVLGVVGLLAGVGYVQVRLGEGAWPDLRLPAEYLAEHVEPGQQLLINESWPFTMHLYTSGRIESPWYVFDAYRLTHDAAGADVCDYDWMVDVRGSYRWPSAIVADLERCDSFERVFSSTSIVTNPGTDFRFVSYPVETVIWKDTGRAE